MTEWNPISGEFIFFYSSSSNLTLILLNLLVPNRFWFLSRKGSKKDITVRFVEVIVRRVKLRIENETKSVFCLPLFFQHSIFLPLIHVLPKSRRNKGTSMFNSDKDWFFFSERRIFSRPAFVNEFACEGNGEFVYVSRVGREDKVVSIHEWSKFVSELLLDIQQALGYLHLEIYNEKGWGAGEWYLLSTPRPNCLFQHLQIGFPLFSPWVIGYCR